MRSTMLVLATLSVYLLANVAAAQDAEDAVRVFQKIEPSVVGLESVASSGTGVLLDKQGHILTNAHVVAMPLGFKCLVDVERDGKKQTVVYKSVKVLGVHPKLDLALAKIDTTEHNVELVPASLLKQKAETGQRVYAIGNPGLEDGVNLRKTITEGLLSGVDRLIDEIPYYQFSAAINPGNSGGPLCDRAGNVIGLVTLKRSDLEGVGFAIPLNGLNRADFRPLTERKGDPRQAAQYIAYANAIVDGINRLEDPRIKNSKRMESLRAVALQAYREALLVDPGNPTTYSAIGELLTTSKEYEAAEAHFVCALELAPWGKDSRHYRAYGVLKLAQMKPREAEIIWLEGIAKHPTESRQIWEDLATLYRDNKQWNQVALCANTSIFTSMSSPAPLSRVMPCMQMAMDAVQKIAVDERPRIQAQVRELPTDLTRQILRRNALLTSKRLVITNEFGELMSRRSAGLNDSLLSITEAVPVPATSKVSDLLVAADPATASVNGRWEANNGIWHSPETSPSGIGFAAEVLPEFDLAVEVERIAGQGELVIAVPCQQQTVMFIVDFGGSRSGVAGVRDGLYTSPVLPTGSPVSLDIRIRKDTFAVSANGREIYVRAMSERFPAAPASWQIPSTANVFIGAKNSRFRICGCWMITPVKTAFNASSLTSSSEPGSRPRPAVRQSAEATPSITPSSPKVVAAGKIDVRELSRIPEMGWGVQAMAFSANGKYLAVGKMDEMVWVFDVSTGRRVAATPRLDDIGQVGCVAFSPDGAKLVYGGSKGKIDICRFDANGQFTRERSFLGHSEELRVLRLSDDGKFALSGGRDKRLRYWNVETAKEEFTFDGFERELLAAAFCDGGARAWATDGRALLQYDLKTGEKSHVNRVASYASAAAMSPDGKIVAISDGAKIRTFRTESGIEEPLLTQVDTARAMVFTPDSKRLLSGDRETFNLWDLSQHNKLATVKLVDVLSADVLAVSSSGQLVAAISGAAGQTLRIFELPESQ